MEHNQNLLSDLANPLRLKIMHILDESSNTFTDLTKRLSISNSEVSRHISRLSGQNFIIKHASTKILELTPFGKIMLTLFAPIIYILDNSEFFKTHDFLDLPYNLITEIDSLDECEYIDGTGNVMLKLQEITERAKYKSWVLTSQIFPFGKDGLDSKYIVTEEFRKFSDHALDQNKSTEARFLAKIPIAIIIVDEKEAMIFFPDLKGKSDFSTGFYAHEEVGLTFVLKIWDYFWKIGKKP